MDQITLLAHCKINLGLSVVGVRPDGYHDLRTVMVRMSLADSVTVSVQGRQPCIVGSDHQHAQHTVSQERQKTEHCLISVSTDRPDIPVGNRNLAYRAAEAYLTHGRERQLFASCPAGVSITISKRIPAGAGLGGGSADAAAVLLALDTLLARRERQRKNVGASPDLISIATSIGSDVPFFLRGPVCLAEGRGERLKELSFPGKLYITCAMPQGELSTKAVYSMYDVVGADCEPRIEQIMYALESNQLHMLKGAVYNSLEKAAVRLLPQVKDIKQLIESTGPVCASMTGSGSCVFGVYPTLEEAQRAHKIISRDPRVSWCAVTKSVNEVLCGEASD